MRDGETGTEERRKMMAEVTLYDTTLRDGAQMEGMSLSVHDKLRIAERLDGIGVRYIEGGWPGSNPKDEEFFAQAKSLPLANATLTAFGSTRRANGSAEDDANLRALLESGAPVVTLVGKASEMQASEVLEVPLEENLAMIRDSVAYLRAQGRRVFFDAEHFFDGYAANPEYALQCVRAAADAGAECVVLCDTNGGDAAGGRVRGGERRRRSAGLRGGDSLPQRRGRRGGEHDRRGAGGRDARAGDDQRLRRALRQREPALRHSEPETETRHRRRGPTSR